MSRYPKSIAALPALLIHTFILPISFLIALLFYEPSSFTHLMHSGAEEHEAIGNVYLFNIVIVATIILVSTLMERLLLFFMRRRLDLDIFRYGVWCFGEVLVTSLFVAMYLSLMDKSDINYFEFLGRSLTNIFSVLVFPYVIVALMYIVYEAPQSIDEQNDKRMKFYDNRHLLKFTTLSSSVVFVEAQENYLLIHYLENGKAKKYELRNSMKSIEAMCEKVGFVRTHRSYLVNPQHVKLVAKGEDGRYYATTDLPGDFEIPVSKRYHANIVAILD